ncbi:hypothetical protein [Leeuwenhoekiella nanhaiensis]|uniref:Secretion system C-terminal sorting domain-containing protein n=1 Tax=Leeuwenhoekiella nanhaiensis TaxID=1655491 RepID=A0A2G1VT52_9FLAO|nr:hypothetical protein [Leeuwenhoekiella nanhaiensis]PHQ29924.1 hypothetical protein CJ305_08110 [Leeuwenhoekiella nanhaiensis]
MKSKLYIFGLLLFLSAYSWSQAPNWNVAESNFEHSMSLVSFLNVNGKTLGNPNDMIAAFVNGECRGVSKLTYVSAQGAYYAYLSIFSNSNGETLNFKIYDSEADTVTDLTQTMVFKINQHTGDLFQPYSFAQPALNKNAAITDLNLMGIEKKDLIIGENTVVLKVASSTDLSAQNVVFQLSTNADAFVGTTPVISGSNSMNLTNDVTLSVRSEDRSVVKDWKVSVQKVSDIQIYKKDAVCYAPGAIKVTSSGTNESFNLSLAGNVIQTKTSNGESIIFENLATGTYTISTSGFSKSVTIIQKQ